MRERKKSFQHEQVYQNNHYKVEKLLPGKHGGKKVVLRRWEQDTEWAIKRTEEHGVAPPGNPLRFIFAMPQEIVDFFGFGMLDSDFKPTFSEQKAHYLVIPDVFEINGALKKLDKLLVKHGYFGIPFRFYLDEDVISNESFLVHFQNDFGLPFSTDSLVSFHDLNYHLIPMLILNQKMLSMAKLHNEVFLKFAAWLRLNHPEVATDSNISSVFGIRSQHLDNTGNLSLLMSDPYFTGHHSLSVRSTKGFIGWGLSPYSYLSETIKAYWKDSTNLNFRDITPKMLTDFEKTLPPEFLTADPETSKLVKNIDTVLGHFYDRILEIQNALK